MFDFIKNPFSKANQEEQDDFLRAKRERIDFHRKSVRNGPVKFKTPTSGQLRRQHDRAIARQIQRTRKAQVAEHFGRLRQAAIVQGKLATVGIGVSDFEGKPYLNGFEARTKQGLDAARWLIVHFAHAEVGETIEITDKAISDAFREALNFWQETYGKDRTDLPEGYVTDVLQVA